jgi:predicted nucleotidyltransferase
MKTIEQARVVSDEEKALLGDTKKVIQNFLPTAEVLLYGSAARGTQGPESDYDVLVLTDRPISTKEEDRVRDAVYDLQVVRGELISTFFCTKDFWDKHPGMPFHQEVDKDAIVL